MNGQRPTYNIYDEVSDLMLERGYTWLIGHKHVNPTAADIQQVVDKAAATLYTEPDGALVEVGRLIIQKNDGHIDIYLHIGATK